MSEIFHVGVADSYQPAGTSTFDAATQYVSTTTATPTSTAALPAASVADVDQTPTPTVAAAITQAVDPSAFMAELRGAFPWLSGMDLPIEWFQSAAATASNSDEFLASLRSTPQYRKRFPGLYRSDGSLRMSEAEYMNTENSYRQLLSQYGYDTQRYSAPGDLLGFFENEIDPNELGQRFEVYDQVQRGGQELKDAYYVYAGINLSDDDLYRMVVDPNARGDYEREFNHQLATDPVSYVDYVARVADVSRDRVLGHIEYMKNQARQGAPIANPFEGVSDDFLRQWVDLIITGGEPDLVEPLSLQDTIAAFEYAVIGAAAERSGLNLPDKDTLAKIRQAGVSRTQAIQQYTSYGAQKGILDGASQRAGFGGLTQEEFEQGTFLGDADAAREIQAAVAREEAAGRSGGGFRFQERLGRLTQTGFST